MTTAEKIAKLISDADINLHILLLIAGVKDIKYFLSWIGYFITMSLSGFFKPFFKSAIGSVRPDGSGEGGMPSGHLTAISYLVMTFFLNNMKDATKPIYILIAMVLIGLVGWSRHKLKKHTISQIVAGILFGGAMAFVFNKLIDNLISAYKLKNN
jgi:membrane-associated phospholipid phosphatase